MKKLILLSVLMSSLSFAQSEYRVPVRPELEAFAHFTIKNVSVKTAEGILSLAYNLPQELVGKKTVRIALSGPSLPQNGSIILSGEKGEALCKTPRPMTLECAIAMKNLTIDPVGVAEVLGEISVDQVELVNRIKVAEQFRGEPAGIIIYSGYPIGE